MSIKKLLFFLLLSLSVVHSYAQPIAIRGVHDLSNQSFNNSNPVPLNGEWEFFWRELYNPDDPIRQMPTLVNMPHMWNEDENIEAIGYATYKLKILLPANHPELALSVPDMYTAYSIYINGNLVSQNGNVATNKTNHTSYWQPETISIGRFADQEIDLILHISNFEHSKGGIRVPILLGGYSQLKLAREVELGYLFLLAGCLIMGSLFFFGLYFFGKSERAIFYFALFCVVYSYRILGTELYPLHYLLPNLPWWLTTRLEYLSLYFSTLLFGIFIKELYPEEANPSIFKAFTVIFGLFSVTAILLPPIYFTALINYFFIMMGVYITYVTHVMITASLHRRVGSIYTLISVGVIFFVFIYDLLEYYTLVTETLVISFLGYMTFFFLQSLTLSNRFSHSLNESKEQAETASTAKTHFLSTMGHELRTPLNAVIGLSELLLDSKSEEEKTQFAQTIKKSGENLLGIINNILDFTKIESDEVEFEEEPTHIPSLLADTVKMLGSLTNPKKVKLSFRFDESLPDYINVDASRLQQILINLMGNAIKFTDEGEISIQVTSTESISEKGQILFIIKDTGIGIAEEKMSLLFDRFSQIDADRNRKYGGTGLGLAISKRLIEGMGGRIWVQSTIGKGTTFYFTIKSDPLNDQAVKLLTTSTKKKSSTADPRINILVVEDNLINQKVIIKVLERLGFTTDIANNGFEAVEMVQQTIYDLIFMDMEMPEMDGIQATEKIRAISPIDKTPIIVAMTANATTEDKARCFEVGMKDFIAKPITLNSTEEVLIKWFSSSKNLISLS